jgi:hypothetical protein
MRRTARNVRLQSVSHLDEPMLHFPVLSFLTTRGAQCQLTFSRHALLDGWTSFECREAPRNRVPINSALDLVVPIAFS